MTDPIELAIEQLHENEALTNAMPDEAAQILLDWGKRQLQDVNVPETEIIETVLHHLQQAMRTINRLIEQHAELTETELVERLIKLVEQAMQLATQKSLVVTPGDNHETL